MSNFEWVSGTISLNSIFYIQHSIFCSYVKKLPRAFYVAHYVARGFALFYRLTLVVRFFATHDRNLNLDLATFTIHRNGHDCQPSCGLARRKLAELLFGEEKTAVAHGVVALLCIARLVWVYRRADEKRFASAHRHMRAIEGAMSGAEGFDLDTEKLDTGFVSFKDLIVEVNLFVLDKRHNAIIAVARVFDNSFVWVYN